jgi:hypothetical protein
LTITITRIFGLLVGLRIGSHHHDERGGPKSTFWQWVQNPPLARKEPPFAMRFLLLVYIDEKLLGQLTPAQFDEHMRRCLHHADELKSCGKVLDYQQLEPTPTAKSVRVRDGRTSVVDGPFAETKEMLAGFNLIEAASMEEAVRLAQEWPWTRYGCIEVRPVRDITAVRERVGA